MKKVAIFFTIFTLILFFYLQCNAPSSSNDDSISSSSSSSTSSSLSSSSSFTIIADHTIVDFYDTIPQVWIDEVKKMLVDIAGESHSAAYRRGMDLLEAQDSRFQVTTFSGIPPEATDDYVRLGRHGSVGEGQFFTNQAAIDNIKQLITDYENAGNPLYVIGLGWCWDFDRNSCTATRDPVYNVGWAGSTANGPEGDRAWGLDSEDQAITGNSVCADTYLNAIVEYTQYCNDNNYQCVPIFTTGPVDGYNGTENGFQREIKHDYIRNYVNTNGGALFDYADILCYNDNGVLYEYTWNDGGTLRVHKGIHPNNLNNIVGGSTGHIGEVGALRLGKAMWWFLARLAGWDGNP